MQPSIYLPHGGGPCFFMDWTMGPADLWDNMQHWLEGLAATLPRQPDAILVISAHWAEAEFRVTGNPQPSLIYDYHGFPEHTYSLRYPAPGSPALAQTTRALLETAGLPCIIDPQRGFDHGVFIPLMLVFPHAQIPVVQLSLRQDMDPAAHLAAGRALQQLRQQNILIIGSGMSFHNMQAAQYPQSSARSQAFDEWLTSTCAAPQEQRELGLMNWEQAPHGRFSHPTEEHLLPLMVNAGAAGADPGRQILADNLGGNAISAIQF